ncbi:MAG: DUF4388 domain-containing protein [Desulforhopalus sp.]
MNTIIIIEHEAQELETLVSLFKQWNKEVTFLTAMKVRSAITIASRRHIDLVVCDLAGPRGCSLEDLSLFTRSFPSIPCIALTGDGGVAPAEIMKRGASHCFVKPLKTMQFLDKAEKLLNAGSSGTVKGIPIYSFLQMLETEEKTCTLQVSGQDGTGQLFIQDGRLIGAETNSFSGEEAARLILSWQESSLEIRFFNGQRRRQINKPLISIIMEAFQLKKARDKKKKEAGDGSPHQVPLKHISTMGKRIPLAIGSRIKLEFPHVNSLFEGVMVGMVPEKCLIVTNPRPYADMESLIGGEQRVIVKYVHEGRIWMFKSLLANVIESPAQLLFFEYPGVIHYHELRESKRTAIYIPSTVQFDQQKEFYGALVDLSMAGCLCLIKHKNETPAPRLDINTPVVLRCLLPGIKEEQELCGRVKNIQGDDSETKVGISFENLQPHLSDTIGRYLYSIESLTG